MGQDVRSASALAFGRVILGAEKVQRNVRLITNDPAVVRHRRNVKQVACVKLNYATIVERNCRGSRENEPDVFNRDNASRQHSGRRARSISTRAHTSHDQL